MNRLGAVLFGYREGDRDFALLRMEDVHACEPETVLRNLAHPDVVVQDIARMPDEVVYLGDYRMTPEGYRVYERSRHVPLHEDQKAMHATLEKASRTMDEDVE